MAAADTGRAVEFGGELGGGSRGPMARRCASRGRPLQRLVRLVRPLRWTDAAVARGGGGNARARGESWGERDLGDEVKREGESLCLCVCVRV